MRAMSRAKIGVLGGMLALTLAGCATPPETASLRKPGTLISSASLFDAERFGGEWHVVESGIPGCSGTQNWAWDGKSTYRLRGTNCAITPAAVDEKVTLTGPGGRLLAKGAFGGEPIWVLWVDFDYRVAVLGTPSGRWGMILSRQTPPRPDLIKAARDVMDFNGYDMTQVGK
ncbi:lipocalin family protein [Thioclava electrotropha]|uniref:Lipocalin n=1 Tax=Thioclava electrotropha TaxID=1549850 RepID=A0ABX6YYK6_9RHOB|nr:lipocalin family protein [Thioclava electrotropha]QPZ92354.1 lipocalin [Thioclava electrotropha]